MRNVLFLLFISAALSQTWQDYVIVNYQPDTDTAEDLAPAIATDKLGNWITVWSTDNPIVGSGVGKGSDLDIIYSLSTNNGQAWTRPDVVGNLATVDTEDDNNADIAYAGSHKWLVVWETNEVALPVPHGTDQDLFFSVYDDVSSTWSNTQLLTSSMINDTYQDSNPRVACTDTYCVVVWWAQPPISPGVGIPQDLPDIYYAVAKFPLSDWSASIPIKAVSDTKKDLYPAITVNKAGLFVIAWRATQNGQSSQILTSKSADNGTTWTAPMSVISSLASGGNLRDDEIPAIATNGHSAFIITWYTRYSTIPLTVPNDWDLVYVRSNDSGSTWTIPHPLDLNAIADPGNVSTETTNYASAISIASDGNQIWIVTWYGNRPSAGNDTDIFYIASTDDGATWTYPSTILAYMNTDNSASNDAYPRLANSGGNWVVTWQSEYGGTETDNDIYTSASLGYYTAGPTPGGYPYVQPSTPSVAPITPTISPGSPVAPQSTPSVPTGMPTAPVAPRGAQAPSAPSFSLQLRGVVGLVLAVLLVFVF